jgi:hypothetical protein
MTIGNVIKIATTTGGGGGGGGGSSMCIIGGCGPGSVDVISTAPVGTENGLVTRPIITGIVDVNVVSGGAAGTVANTFGTVTLVPSGVQTTIVTYIVPAGVTFQCVGYIAGGDTNAAFTLYINGTPVLMSRSTVAQQTVQTSFFGANPPVAAGQPITLKVIQQNTGIQGNFEGTILGSYQ